MKVRDYLNKLSAAREAKAKTMTEAQAILDSAAQSGVGLDAAGQAKYDSLFSLAKTQDLSVKNWEQQYQDAMAADNHSMGGGGGSGYAFNGSAGSVSVGVDRASLDPNGGFARAGDFLMAVKNASLGMHDPRLSNLASVPGVVSSGTSGKDGGFAIPVNQSNEIWSLAKTSTVLLPYTQNVEIETGYAMSFPKDETTPWSPSGIKAFWQNEAKEALATKLDLGLDTVNLHTLAILVPITNQMMESGAAMDSYLSNIIAPAMGWKIDSAILGGTGIGQPKGCIGDNAALITVAKETGQAAGTIVQQNISKMRSRLVAGSLKDAVWIGNPDILPALESLIVGQIPIFLPPGTGLREGGYDGTLNGRPLILSEFANGLGKSGDLSLLSLKGYRTVTRVGGFQTATSMHLYFDADAMAFRVTFRMGGGPILSQPIPAPAGKSSNTRSFFVTLADRA